MKIILTCYRCGASSFTEIDLVAVKGGYILDNSANRVACNNCNYEDYVHNLFKQIKEEEK